MTQSAKRTRKKALSKRAAKRGQGASTIGVLVKKYRSNPGSLTVAELRQVRELQELQAPKDTEAVPMELAAELLGCTPRNIVKLRAEKKISAAKRGCIDLRSICTYLRDYRDQRYRGSARPEQDTEAYYKKECLKLRSELMRIAVKKEQLELVDMRKVRSQFRVASNRLRIALEAVGREYGRPVGEAIREAIDVACNELGMSDADGNKEP